MYSNSLVSFSFGRNNLNLDFVDLMGLIKNVKSITVDWLGKSKAVRDKITDMKTNANNSHSLNKENAKPIIAIGIIIYDK